MTVFNIHVVLYHICYHLLCVHSLFCYADSRWTQTQTVCKHTKFIRTENRGKQKPM